MTDERQSDKPDTAQCEHDWHIWPETDGMEQRCRKCKAYRSTPEADKFWLKPAAAVPELRTLPQKAEAAEPATFAGDSELRQAPQAAPAGAPVSATGAAYLCVEQSGRIRISAGEPAPGYYKLVPVTAIAEAVSATGDR